MDHSASTNEYPFNVRGTRINSGDTRDLYRQKIARITLDAMVQFVGLLDATGTVLEINHVALDAVGIKLSDVEGKPFWTTFWWLVSDEINATLRESIARAAGGEFVRWDTPIYGRAAGKETIIIDASLSPVFDENGKVVFICAEGRDITEKKAQERLIEEKNIELQALLQRVRELDEIKTQFFANVSHELRTPLSLIIGPADRLIKDAQALSHEQHQESARVIARNARMLLKHVNDLLDISKLDAGKLKIMRQNIDAVALIRLSLSHFEVLAADRKIKLVVEAPNNAICAVDPAKIQRIVMNLLSNAFKFVPDGGTIQVTVTPSDDTLVFSVEDSGPGVKPEMRNAIFERFRQADGGTNRQFGGTGLGLSIAEEFVKMHEGTLEIDDSHLGGTSFVMTLPAVVLPQDSDSSNETVTQLDKVIAEGYIEELIPGLAVSAPSVSNVNSGAKPVVLVVEDNVDMNRFISETLSRSYNVVSAYNGQEGFDKALESPPSLIVSDIMMPKVSGVQMIAQMRNSATLKNIPILLLSAKADEDLKVELLKNGAQDFVHKPFSEADLFVRVGNLLSLKSVQDQLAKSNEELERRVLERTRELETARDEALRANKLKTQFVANISHEIRTPMSGILGLTEFLVLETSGETQKTAQHVFKSAKSLMILVNDLLDLSKLEAGRIDVRDDVILVEQVVDETLTALYMSAKRKQLTLSESVDPQVRVKLRGDAGLIRQILQNLVQNAIKFTDTGGVKVDACAETQEDDKKYLRFCVSDTGPGIAPEDQKKLFQLFVQVDGSTTRRHGGTGMGLALSKRLVELMGGAIGVDSAPGKGSAFWFSLPLRIHEG
jgi:PAS domain S-box-containing protein